MQLTPLTGTFGAEATDVDLGAGLDPAEVEELRAAFHANGVLVVRDQQLTLEQFESFAASLGTVTQSPFVTPVEGHPDVLCVKREADEEATAFGEGWHSDWSFQPAPPAATLLYAADVPAAGGDTVFSSMHLAVEALSPAMVGMLDGLRVTHSAGRYFAPQAAFAAGGPDASMEIRPDPCALAEQSHPMVVTHPVTGRRSIFANECYTTGIEGMSAAESQPLLRFVYDHLARVAFTLRVRWRPGTLTMWDNLAVQHYAVDDYAGTRRELYRIVLAGEPPI
ncbi:MAG TPA: TauD/TfdA family dioxygenase [Acidimicrobiaceae bacterium]|nr:TauD/TfdA family dioxygenase [Acidimicrobiaceae bacterium]HCB37101.1 TauD/TfdA family dioxygenase [Acidimicrobiaceae bacterium]